MRRKVRPVGWVERSETHQTAGCGRRGSLRSTHPTKPPRIENMNFDDTPQEAAFRAEAKAWISANAPKQYEEELRKSSLGRSALTGVNILEVAKAWQKKKADAGWACLHWPKEYGGRGSSPDGGGGWAAGGGRVGQHPRGVA